MRDLNLCYSGLFPEKVIAFVEKERDAWSSQKADCHLPQCVASPPVLEVHLTEFRNRNMGND